MRDMLRRMTMASLLLTVLASFCQTNSTSANERAPSDARLPWAEVLEVKPDVAVVTDARLRDQLERTGLPWRVKDKSTGIEMLLVPPGKYRRGASPADVEAEDDEKPPHEITITQAFYLGRYEVTQAQWQAVMGSNPSTKLKEPQAPVETVSHEDISSFNRKTGLQLPTESEWEYACRAGTTGASYGELDSVAWYKDNSGMSTHPVGQKRANALGLHDMLGNVCEWCSDWYSADEYDRCSGGAADPKGPSTGDLRVVRGGSWLNGDWFCDASDRARSREANRSETLGFRASRALGGSSLVPLHSPSDRPEMPTNSPAKQKAFDSLVPWAEVLESNADPAVVTDSRLRGQIEKTGLPWRVKDKDTGIEMLLVPPGKYQRGASTEEDEAKDHEKPSHDVTITQPFYLGRYEVTQAQWQAATGSNPSLSSIEPTAPVENVSFDEIAAFGEECGMRLPTEAEWEYACRAGTTGARYGELDAVAWCEANPDFSSHPVGQKSANALGLHDILGNVAEWCSDWYAVGEYDRCSGGAVDPRGPKKGSSRVVRGGSWIGGSYDCRSAFRGYKDPSDANCFIGFRVARTPDPVE